MTTIAHKGRAARVNARPGDFLTPSQARRVLKKLGVSESEYCVGGAVQIARVMNGCKMVWVVRLEEWPEYYNIAGTREAQTIALTSRYEITQSWSPECRVVVSAGWGKWRNYVDDIRSAYIQRMKDAGTLTPQYLEMQAATS